VTVDLGSRVRRTLSMTTPASDAMWAGLTPGGVELKVSYGIRLAARATEPVRAPGGTSPIIWIPLGVFIIDSTSIDYGPSGTMSITAPDRWARVQRADFEQVKQTSGNAVNSMVDLVYRAFTPNGEPAPTLTNPPFNVIKQGTFRFNAPTSLWTSNRDDAIHQLCMAATVDVFFDPVGNLVVRPKPVLAGAQPIWSVNTGMTGVQLSAARTRDRQKTFNVICVRPSSTDGTSPFALVTVEDRDPKSPTYARGIFGRSVFQYSNPLVRSANQASHVAVTLLDRYRALAAQLSMTSVVNPALDAGDCIGAVLPRKRGLSPAFERHLIESLTVPLTVEGTQSIQTRSTRPDDEDDGGLSSSSSYTWGNVYDTTVGTGDEASWTVVTTDFSTWNDLVMDWRLT